MEIKKFFHKNKASSIVYLHGGPIFEINNLLDDPYITELYQCGFNIIVLNYGIFDGDGGRGDYLSVLQTIENIQKNYNIITIVGDSYGGYLASLLSFHFPYKTVVISDFISIDYQKLFSTESTWLTSYLSAEAPDYLSFRNQYHDNHEITFIQGTADSQCPVQQFLTLNHDGEKLVLLKNSTHREIGDKLKKAVQILVKEVI